MQLNILYIHGFISSAQSLKAQVIRQWAGQNNYCFHCPTYPQYSAAKSVAELRHILDAHRADQSSWMIIGSSLGGFYAQFLAHKYSYPYVMINPALDPFSLFERYQGEHQNPQTQEQVLINPEYLTQLANYEIQVPDPRLVSLLLMDEKDEVIDVAFAKQKYSGLPLNRTRIYSEGNHDFTHMAEGLLEIERLIATVQSQSRL